MQRAIADITDMILRGDLSPGARLPAEDELASSLGVSRNSLREAAKVLSYAGVLDVRRGDGTYVTLLDGNSLIAGMQTTLSLLVSGGAAGEALDVRRILEVEAIRLATTHITDDEVDAIEAHIRTSAELTDIHELVEADIVFHDMIAAASRNETLRALCRSLSLRTFRVRVWRGVTEANAGDLIVKEHTVILEQLTARDAALAAAAMSLHIGSVKQRAIQALDLGEIPNL